MRENGLKSHKRKCFSKKNDSQRAFCCVFSLSVLIRMNLIYAYARFINKK